MWRILLIISLYWLTIPVTANPTDTAMELWRNLAKTKNQCPNTFDYYPNGGLRIFYCHLKTFTDLTTLEELAGMPAFLRGPHTQEPDFKAKYNFGHYNPQFVKWLVEHFIPASQDPIFLKQSQPMYDTYVKPLARTYYATHVRLYKNTSKFREALNDYQNRIKNKQLSDFYADKYFSFAKLNEITKYNFNGNVVKHSVLFWLRRHIDKTDKLFYRGLNLLLDTYDPLFRKNFACLQQPTESTMLIICAQSAYLEMNQTLENLYQDLLQSFPLEKQKILQQAQTDWVRFRDSNAELLAETYTHISNHDQAVWEAKMQLTQTRIAELKNLNLMK